MWKRKKVVDVNDLVSQIERLQVLQSKQFRVNVERAIEALANRIRRVNDNA